ncbi:MAG: sulfotransferase [Gammaproteobacteria bacterium]|nr:sulfotransferase [Gammaproteobacteria bacterium]
MAKTLIDSDLASFQPVFLICSERSGSNLIRSMLDAHPRVFAPASFHIGRHIGRHFHRVGPLTASNPRWDIVIEEIGKRVDRHVGSEQAARVKSLLNETELSHFGDVLRVVYGALIDPADGIKYVFVKENHIHEQASFLLHYFPDAKFVFQVRDPRDYFASVKAMKEGWLRNKYGSTRVAMSIWRDDQLGGLNLLGHLGPERVYFQRYEDLIADPESVLTGLCQFLDLEFDAEMLAYHRRDSTRKMAGKLDAWSNLARPVMSDNANKYRKVLSSGSIRMVETWLGDLMKFFDYPLEFPERKVPKFWPTIWPQLLEPIERYANGDKSPFYSAQGVGFLRRLSSKCPPLKARYAEGQTDDADESTR